MNHNQHKPTPLKVPNIQTTELGIYATHKYQTLKDT